MLMGLGIVIDHPVKGFVSGNANGFRLFLDKSLTYLQRSIFASFVVADQISSGLVSFVVSWRFNPKPATARPMTITAKDGVVGTVGAW